MKKVIYLLILISLLLLFCSCNKEDEQADPDYTVFTRSKNNNIDITNNIQNDNTLDETISKTESLGSEIENVAENKWPYELNFTGINSKTEGKLGNSNNNRNIHLPYTYLVCYDADNDTTYYVNYGYDNYIYQLKDGVSSLLVDKEAMFLQLWNNELYFVCNNHKYKNYPAGDIYSYNLTNNKLNLMLETDAKFLTIDSYGIYFDKLDDDGFLGYNLDFGASQAQQVDYIDPLFYNEYQIYAYKNEGVFLHNRDTHEKIFLAPVEYFNKYMSIYEHYLVFTNKSVIYMLDLLNGEKKIYDINDTKTLDYEVLITDYIIIDNIIYATSSSTSIYKFDLNTGLLEVYVYNIENFNAGYSIESLFTDGSNIYAAMQAYGNVTLVKLSLTKDEDDMNIINVEALLK